MPVARLLASAASDNAASGYVGRSMLKTIIGHNTNAAARWLKIYDTKAVPTNADVPVLTFYLPAQTAFSISVEALLLNGCGYRITANGADNDATAIAANDILALNIVLAA